MWISVSCMLLLINVWPNEELGRESINQVWQVQLDMGWPGTHSHWGCLGGREEAHCCPQLKSETVQQTQSEEPRASHQHLLRVLGSPEPPIERAEDFHARCQSKRLWLDMGKFYVRMKENKIRNQRILIWSWGFLQFLITCVTEGFILDSPSSTKTSEHLYTELTGRLIDSIRTQPDLDFSDPSTYQHSFLTLSAKEIFFSLLSPCSPPAKRLKICRITRGEEGRGKGREV